MYQYSERTRLVLIFLIDAIGIIAIFSSVYYFRLGVLPKQISVEFALIFGLIISTMFLLGTYLRGSFHILPRLPVNTFYKALFSIIPCIVVVYILGPEKFTKLLGRGVLPVGIILFGVWATLNRYIINRLYFWQHSNEKILCLSTTDGVENFKKELKINKEFRQLTFATEDGSLLKVGGALTMQWNEILMLPDFRVSKETTRLLVKQRLSGVPILALPEFCEYHWFKVPVSSVGDDWIYLSQGFSSLNNGVAQRLKRSLDVFFAFVLLLMNIPILLLTIALISLTSKGPAVFKQRRVGLNGKEFTIYKLRTMYIDAESEGAIWAKKADIRITKIGKLLRSSRLDELPQLWNVLKGDMSLVGPRPERPEFTKSLTKNIPYYDLRNIVKPGLTGWAQVMYPYGASEEDALRKLEYDLYYIKHQSILFDFNIFIRTILVVCGRQGR